MTPTAIATTKVAHLLNDWGSPRADNRAQQLIDLLTDLGWRPPRDDTPPPLAGPTSTAEGRQKARRIYEQTRREKAGHADTASR